jgi:spermidine synthase
MPRPLDQYYRCYAERPEVAGNVLEVGLGEGNIARYLLPQTRVTDVTHYERDSATVTDYRSAWPDPEPKHTIYEEDFLLAPSRPERFHSGIIDVFTAQRPAVFANARDIVDRMEPLLRSGGRLFVEYQGDTTLERQFRQFMRARFGRFHKAFFNTGHPASSRFIGWYRKS